MARTFPSIQNQIFSGDSEMIVGSLDNKMLVTNFLNTRNVLIGDKFSHGDPPECRGEGGFFWHYCH